MEIGHIWTYLSEPIVDGFYRQHPILGSIFGFIIFVLPAVEWVRQRRKQFDKKSLHIHYTYKTREELFFESITTINVLKNNLREYKSGFGGTRLLTTPLSSRDPTMRVTVDAAPAGSRQNFTILFDPPLSKGKRRIPLEGGCTDPNTRNPKILFEIPTRLEELVVVVKLPQAETITFARSSVFKPGHNDCNHSEELWVWRENIFVAVFRKVKPHWKYEVTWEYGKSASPIVGSIQ